jgi:transposase
VQVRDRLGEIFPDAAFAEAFGRAGKPGWSPGRLALVTVLQKAASLTDRQTADEVRENLAWKYALGLGLEAIPVTLGAVGRWVWCAKARTGEVIGG